MPPSRRLTDEDRQQITRERAAGVSVAVLASRFGVTERSVYRVLRHGHQARAANGSRVRVLTLRVTESELHGFDARLAGAGIGHRSEALRRMVTAAGDLLSPDREMTDQLRSLGAALSRVGNNVNQIARRLNEGRGRGAPASLSPSETMAIRALAGLVFDMADQVQEMSRNRRAALQLEVDKALAPLVAEAQHGTG